MTKVSQYWVRKRDFCSTSLVQYVTQDSQTSLPVLFVADLDSTELNRGEAVVTVLASKIAETLPWEVLGVAQLPGRRVD